MLKEKINTLYDNMESLKNEHDKILFYAFLSGVVKNSLNESQVAILEKELAYYREKDYLHHAINYELKHNNMDESLAYELLNDLNKAREYFARA